jgi:hypothetical protein
VAIEIPPCLEDVPFKHPIHTVFSIATFDCKRVCIAIGLKNIPLACCDGLHRPLRLFDFLELTLKFPKYGGFLKWWYPKMVGL